MISIHRVKYENRFTVKNWFFFFTKEWKYNDIHPQSQIWKPIYCQKLIFFFIKEWKYNDIHPQSQIWKPIYCQKLMVFFYKGMKI